MIFDSFDLQVLGRIIMRKGCETAKATFNPDLTDIQRYRWVDEIVQQIARGRIMASLGRNDFSNIESQMAVLKEGVNFMPCWMYEKYVSELSERDFNDEKHFILMCGELIRQSIFLNVALREAEKGLSGDLSLNGLDQLQLYRFRKLIRSLSDDIGDDKEDVSDLREQLETIDRICSVITRIRNGKSVSSVELSIVAKELDGLQWSEFDELFKDVLSSEDRNTVGYFRENSGRYLIAMYTRCILNSKYPESCIIQDKPAF